VREYIGNNHEFKEQESDVHQIEYMFDCSLNKSELKNSGNFLDKWQIGVEWIDLDNFHNYRFYPKFFQNLIDKKGKYCGNVYLGDVN
jgi:hypothetical protein